MTYKDYILNQIAHGGLVAMIVAAFITHIELNQVKAHEPAQTNGPAAAIKTQPAHSSGGERREEIRHGGVSYGVTMRSHPTAGTI